MKGKKAVLLFVGALLAVGLMFLQRPPAPRSASPEPARLHAVARRGPVEFHLVETGVLQPRLSVTLASELPSNRAKIVRLVPEGHFVRKGDVVVEFDPTPFEEDVAALEKEYDEAEGAVAQVEQELQLEIENARIARTERENKIRMAELRLERLREIEIPLRIAKARQELQEARDRLTEAQQRLADLRDLQKKGYGKRRELEAARREVETLRLRAAHLEKRHRLLREKGGPAEIRLAELELEELRRMAAHEERVAQHKIALRNAALLRARTRLEQLAARLEKARGLLQKTLIRAPVSGFVMLREVAVQGETRKVQIGDSVWFRNGFITLPDMSELVVELDVRESDLGRIAEGQPAEVRPSAWPDLVLQGGIESIGTLSSDSRDKGGPRFRVRIGLEAVDSRLRPGMTATVRIRTLRLDDAVTVPVDAVFRRDGRTVCFVETALGVRAVPVTPGATDGVRIVILDGLDGDERLRLLPPDAAP